MRRPIYASGNDVEVDSFCVCPWQLKKDIFPESMFFVIPSSR